MLIWKQLILQFCFQQSNRVTMKLDVSYTDHSHIIGKGGLTIKRVMEETGCHIHFPDSNRSNHQDKSNQVSIAGEMESVERARARVRVSFLAYDVCMCLRCCRRCTLCMNTDCNSDECRRGIFLKIHKIYIYLYAIEY